MAQLKISNLDPLSLFHQCLRFVADHVEIVDSFAGFPSQIGELIFNLCMSNKKFMDKDLTALTLFASEFRDEVLNSLNLSGEFLCLNYYLEQFLLFTSLTELDVSYCGLGDDHEILTHFSNIYSLKVLSLQGNSISNAGIQKMTTPYRMLGKGPGQIKLLDISGNSKVFLNVLKYLSPFKSLTVILSDILREKSSEYANWDIKKDTSSQTCCIETKGWARDLIDEWKIKVKSKKPCRGKKTSFYSKPQLQPCYTADDKRQNFDIVVAINRITDKQKQSHDIPKNVPKRAQNDVDEQSLLALYGKTTSNDSNYTGNSHSVLDLIDSNSSSHRDSSEYIHRNSHTVKSKISKQIPWISDTLVEKQNQAAQSCHRQTCSSKKKSKENKGSITHYFNSNIHTRDNDKLFSQKPKSTNAFVNEKLCDNNKPTISEDRVGNNPLKLCKSMCSNSVKQSTGDRPNRKRKRIVITKPLPCDKTSDVNREKRGSSKYQKLETNSGSSRQTSYSSSKVKPSSFLECLDSY